MECVYKPVEGERPLWDFPHRTLGFREVAAYEVSRIGGFDCVPVTVFTDGTAGSRVAAGLGGHRRGADQAAGRPGADRRGAKGWFPCVQGWTPRTGPSLWSTPTHRPAAARRLRRGSTTPNRKGGHILGSGGGSSRGTTGSLPHRPQAAHPALGVGRRRARRTRADRGPPGPGTERPSGSASCSTSAEVAAFVRRADLLLQRKRLPRQRGECRRSRGPVLSGNSLRGAAKVTPMQSWTSRPVPGCPGLRRLGQFGFRQPAPARSCRSGP